MRLSRAPPDSSVRMAPAVKSSLAPPVNMTRMARAESTDIPVSFPDTRSDAALAKEQPPAQSIPLKLHSDARWNAYVLLAESEDEEYSADDDDDKLTIPSLNMKSSTSFLSKSTSVSLPQAPVGLCIAK